MFKSTVITRAVYIFMVITLDIYNNIGQSRVFIIDINCNLILWYLYTALVYTRA